MTILTDRAVYFRGGDSIYATIENAGQQDIGFNPCPVILELRTIHGWQQRGLDDGFGESVPCDLDLLRLKEGASYRRGWLLPPLLPEGTYRLRFKDFIEIDRFDANARIPAEQLVSNLFAVR